MFAFSVFLLFITFSSPFHIATFSLSDSALVYFVLPKSGSKMISIMKYIIIDLEKKNG